MRSEVPDWAKEPTIKALVIGGNGFIGSHLVDRLRLTGSEVTVLDLQDRRYEALPAGVHFIPGDVSKGYLVREALAGVDTVFHLAWATIHEVANRDPAADIEVNLIPTVHLIEACRDAGVRRFIFVSSGGTVYGPTRELPIPETHALNPVSAYGITKVAVEKYLEMFRRLYGLDYAVLRPSVPYGPRQNPLARQGAVGVFLYRVGHGLPLTIWGDGTVSRDYFHVSDLVDAFIAAAECDLPDQPRVFNIGGGREISLLELVAQVEIAVGRKAQLDFKPSRDFDVPRVFLDIERAGAVLGWQPRVSLESGLATTWNWMSTAMPG